MADVPNLLRQLAMVQMWDRSAHGGASYVLPGWSISVEWAAYLAFPLLVLVLYRLRRLPVWLLLTASVAAIAPLSIVALITGSGEQHWALRISCCFVAGALAGLAVRRIKSTPRTERAAAAAVWGCLFLIAAGAVWASWRRDVNGASDYAGVIVVFFPVLVVGLTLTDRGPSRWLSTDWMVYGGRISYSLYLVHFAIFDICMTVLWQGVRRGHVTPLMVLAFPGLVIAALLAAAALHHGIEEPGRRLILRAASVRRPAVRPTLAGVPETTERLPYPIPRSAPARETVGVRSATLPPVGLATPGVRSATGRARSRGVLSGVGVAGRE
jgi:peptidoglycan/LPS O-acetylase OafA/YrhL